MKYAKDENGADFYSYDFQKNKKYYTYVLNPASIKGKLQIFFTKLFFPKKGIMYPYENVTNYEKWTEVNEKTNTLDSVLDVALDIINDMKVANAMKLIFGDE